MSRNTVRRLNGPDHFDTLIQSHVLPAEAGTPNLRALAAKSGTTNGFTMVEIAIAVAVIAFALVAIIGVLPAGLQVQKENREDTLMAQDGTYWMEAIRNGAAGLDELGQYVSRIEISNGNVTNAYTDFTPSALSSGAQIIGLLGTPGTVNTATVRAIAGALSEKGSATADIAFKYKMQVTIFPFDASTTPVARDSVENQVLSARLHEVRLLFRWPILPNGSLGNGRQVLRSLVSGEFVTVTNAGKIYYFLRP
ncbi:MAG TPA: hypothetical protein VKM56_11630 [Verrucomicrobiae bacterium]|nr:hypothetical protein [Verrucomicrobiae bacterium]